MLNHVFKLIATVAIATSLVLVASTGAQAQVPKQGKFTGQFGYYGVGQAFQIEENHFYWVGEFTGSFFNDAGKGIFHRSSVKCPAADDIYGGVEHASGYCIITDKDGDKAFLSWTCEGPAQQICKGTFKWTGGTGKYTGITGDNTFQGNAITASEGYALWQAQYQLP